jgi:hypothetical protein
MGMRLRTPPEGGAYGVKVLGGQKCLGFLAGDISLANDLDALAIVEYFTRKDDIRASVFDINRDGKSLMDVSANSPAVARVLS